MKFVLFAVLCSGCLSIEAEIEESCVSRRGVEIEGVAEPTVSRGFLVEDLSEAHRLLDYDADLEFVRADVRPTAGVTSLAFVASAAVAIEGQPVYACDGDCPRGDGIAMLAEAAPRATPYLAADQLAVQVTVTGDLPRTAWTVDVDVCVRGTASYTLAP